MEFRKIKKQVLTETTDSIEASKPENKDLLDQYQAEEKITRGSDIYRDAILDAIRDEDDAIKTYNGILELEKQTDKEVTDLFHDTITHIRDEEKAHFQMLTDKLAKFPGFDVEKELEKAKAEEEKESVKESVQLKEEVAANRTYNIQDIDSVLQKYIDFTDETYDLIADLFYRADDEVSAEEAQNIINTVKDTLHLPDDVITIVENELNKTLSPAEERVDDFRTDMDLDISTIQSILDEGNLRTYAAYNRLTALIAQLEELKSSYHGEKEVGWKVENHITGKNPTDKIIS